MGWVLQNVELALLVWGRGCSAWLEMVNLSIIYIVQVGDEFPSCGEVSCWRVNERWESVWMDAVCVSVCECVCCFVYLLVYTHAYMWEQEADLWVRTPNDSALHGQDSCFMSMGFHKLRGPSFLLLLLLLQQQSSVLFSILSLFFFTHSFFTHTLHISLLLLSLLLQSRCHLNLFC